MRTLHRAQPQDERLGVSACAVCGDLLKQVEGGQGKTWIHSDGYVLGRGAAKEQGA